MIRVLQVVNNMHRAGLETVIMNYYRNIDRSKIQFDFLTHRPERSDYDNEIESLGGKMYYAPRLYPHNYHNYFIFMKEFFKKHPEYNIVHSHIDSMSYLPLLAAKKAGIPVRIAHSHNTAIDKNFKYILKQYFRLKITDVANYYCACGSKAGQFLFKGKEVTFIPNAIETSKFLFNPEIRNIKRKELGVDNEFVIGHIGRLSYQKNHKFLIDIFSILIKRNINAVLVLVGVGEKENELRRQVYNLGIEKKVRFLGKRSDVNDLYQAMDIFVMPSFFEGIPVVGIEAQVSGLTCVFSENVPSEVKLNKNCNFIKLSMSKEKWADKIIELLEDNYNRKHSSLAANSSIYNINYSKKVLENYYKSILI